MRNPLHALTKRPGSVRPEECRDGRKSGHRSLEGVAILPSSKGPIETAGNIVDHVRGDVDNEPVVPFWRGHKSHGNTLSRRSARAAGSVWARSSGSFAASRGCLGKRADNLVVDSSGITMLDWGLLAGIGISQELIKLFETKPTSMESRGWRLSSMATGFYTPSARRPSKEADARARRPGHVVRMGRRSGPARRHQAWLRTVKRICDSW